MEIDFTNLEYLKVGNARQKQARETLMKLGLFESLEEYHPILTGTLPIDIDLPNSDLDIICACQDHERFAELLTSLYGTYQNFKLKKKRWGGEESTIVVFGYDGFEVEVFGQNLPTTEQLAYRHMLVEHKVLLQKGEEFREAIRRLKRSGMKTEPAFAKLLGLLGDPYQELLKVEL